jgi:hypothetical protein
VLQPASATSPTTAEVNPFALGPRRNSAPELRDLAPPLPIPSVKGKRDGALSRRRNLNLECLVQPSLPTPKASKSVEVGGYQTLKVLGRGSSSEVRKILHTKTGKLYAGKVLLSNEGDADKREMITQEYDLLKGLNHPNVVKVFELVDLPAENFMMIVMKHLAGEALSSLIERTGLGLERCSLIRSSADEGARISPCAKRRASGHEAGERDDHGPRPRRGRAHA